MAEQLGDGPIEQKHLAIMNALATGLDAALNGEAKGDDRDNGFVLLVFPFGGETGRCNYISNANREDIAVMLKEQLSRFEGYPEMSGRA